MKMSTSTPEETGRRLGRPPRVTSARIAEAALEVGLDRATIRTVAEHLGMSVPGLRHHVRTREDLLAMAAAHSMAGLSLPPSEGRPWDAWLLDYARFVYEALVAQPELIGQITAGRVDTLRQAQHIEQVLVVLTGAGFEVAEAFAAYAELMSVVTGAAVTEIGRRASLAAGHPRVDDLRRAVGALGRDAVPLAAALLDTGDGDGDGDGEPDPFDAARRAVAALRNGRSAENL